MTALMIAAKKGHIELCGVLLELGADPNMLNTVGLCQIYMLCSQSCCLARLELLAQASSAPDAVQSELLFS